MPPDNRDIAALAGLVADCFTAPRVERVERPQPPRRMSVPETRIVREKRTRREQVGTETHPAVYVVGIAGAIVALALLLGQSVGAGVLVGVVTIVVVLVLQSNAAQPVFGEVSYDEEVPRTFEREEDVPQPPLVEERPVPNGRVRVLGRIGVPVLAVPVRGGVLAVAPPGFGRPVDLALPTFSDLPAVRQLLARLEEYSERVPHILHGDRTTFSVTGETAFGHEVQLVGEESELARTNVALAEAIDARVTLTFRPSILAPGDPLLATLAPRAHPAGRSASFEAARSLVEALHADQQDAVEPMLAAALRAIDLRQATMTGVRYASLSDAVKPICRNLGDMFHYSTFNFYCPSCNETLLKDLLARDYSLDAGAPEAPPMFESNTRCVWRSDLGAWQCRTCETVTEDPLPVHKMMDEVLLPAYDRLMEENKNERLAIYAKAHETETHYRTQLERESEELALGHRSALEHLDLDLRRVEALLAGETEALASLKGLIESSDVAHREEMTRFIGQQVAIAATIAADRAQTVAQMNEVFDTQRAEMLRRMDECSRAKRVEEERRDACFRQMAAGIDRTANATELQNSIGFAQLETQQRQLRVEQGMAGDLNRAANAAETQNTIGTMQLEKQTEMVHYSKRTCAYTRANLPLMTRVAVDLGLSY